MQRSRHALPAVTQRGRRVRASKRVPGGYIDRCNNGVWVDVPYEDASQHPYVPNQMGNLR